MEALLTSLLAPVAGGERYWLRAPQGTKAPYVVMQRITGIRDYHMQGASGLVASRVQIDCYDNTYLGADGMAATIVAILSGYRGGVIQGAFVDGERDLPVSDAGEVKHLFRKSLDIIIHHKEA
jgi:hypothetical protein